MSSRNLNQYKKNHYASIFKCIFNHTTQTFEYLHTHFFFMRAGNLPGQLCQNATKILAQFISLPILLSSCVSSWVDVNKTKPQTNRIPQQMSSRLHRLSKHPKTTIT